MTAGIGSYLFYLSTFSFNCSWILLGNLSQRTLPGGKISLSQTFWDYLAYRTNAVMARLYSTRGPACEITRDPDLPHRRSCEFPHTVSLCELRPTSESGQGEGPRGDWLFDCPGITGLWPLAFHNIDNDIALINESKIPCNTYKGGLHLHTEFLDNLSLQNSSTATVPLVSCPRRLRRWARVHLYRTSWFPGTLSVKFSGILCFSQVNQVVPLLLVPFMLICCSTSSLLFPVLLGKPRVMK